MLQVLEANKYRKYNELGITSPKVGINAGSTLERRSRRVHFRDLNDSTLTRFGEMMLKRLILFSLFLLLAGVASATTPLTFTLSPYGAVLQPGQTLQLIPSCTYASLSPDNCAASGTITWLSEDTAHATISSSGLVTWVIDPNGQSVQFQVTANFIASVGGLQSKVSILGQNSAWTYTLFITPATSQYNDPLTGMPPPLNVVVGSTVTLGMGYTSTGTGAQSGGNPIPICAWSSSNPSVFTVNRYGFATAVAEGSATISCNPQGSANINSGASHETIALVAVNPTQTLQTWYVRPHGGTPYVNGTQTPAGQCDGKHDADYPGTGVNQPCAMGDLEYLYFDQVTHLRSAWMIGSGDTVIVAPNAAGYNAAIKSATSYLPTNCPDVIFCDIPPIPSGTAANHTKILGENYASCHNDSSKTLINLFGRKAFNVSLSQYVDIACFEIKSLSPTQKGNQAILESALTSNVTYTDILAHGMFMGLFGATGLGVTGSYFHIYSPSGFGVNMDDAPYGGMSNIATAGGITWNNSIIEFTGCSEASNGTGVQPIAAASCNTGDTNGSSPDGFGTGNTTGDWFFDHDIWRYNFQGGLDLLHSGLQNVTVTNSQSYGNNGDQYKFGPADSVTFINNFALGNCNRIMGTFGGVTIHVSGVQPCRSGGTTVDYEFDGFGTYLLQNNTLIAVGNPMIQYNCTFGSSNCSAATTIAQNNAFLGYTGSAAAYSSSRKPYAFYDNGGTVPTNGFTTATNNVYYNMVSTLAGASADPLFIGEPPPLTEFTTQASEMVLDTYGYTPATTYNFQPSSSSPLIGAGVAIPDLLTDIAGTIRPNPPSIGALEYAAGTTLSPSLITLTATPNPVPVGQSVTLTASIAEVGEVLPTGTVTFFANGVSLNSAVVTNGAATLSVSSLTAGVHSITAIYTGDSTYAAGASSALALTVNSASATTTKTSLQVSPTAITEGQAVTLTAAVTAASGVPAGTVSFLGNGVVLGSVAVSNSGVATWPISSMAAGSYTLSAQYTGNSTFAASTSPAVTETVKPAAATATETTLQVSSTSITAGQAVTFTAAVTAAAGTPTGTVSFFSNGVVLGSVAVSRAGVATWPISSMAAGSYTLSAQYTGNSTFAASTSPAVTETVKPAPPGSLAPLTYTATSLQVSPNPDPQGQAVTLTATVKTASGIPAGTVSFFSNGTLSGSATLNSQGVATYTGLSLPVGTYQMTAKYSGSSTLAASTSASVAWTVTTPGVNLALSTPSLTVTSGVPTSNSVILTLTPVGGYSGTLQMACVTPPAGTVCSFQPQTVTVNSAPVQVAMTVQTSGTSSTAALQNHEPSTPGNAPAIPASIYWIPGLLAAGLIGKERKRLPRSGTLLLLLLLAGAFGTLTGCGSGLVEILPGAQTVALKVMVTGTGNVAQSITLNVTSK